MTRAVVIVASKYGATREIAEILVEDLRQGFDVRLHDAADVASIDDLDAEGIVFGSAIYMGRWLKPARELLDKHQDELAKRPLWLFSSGPVGDPPVPTEAQPTELIDAAKATGARSLIMFAGRLDAALLSRRERLMVKALRAVEGDYRDWSAIHSWAAEIAAELEPDPSRELEAS